MSEKTSAASKFDWRALALPALVVMVWYALTALHWVNTKLIVPPVGVLTTAAQELTKADFYLGIAQSLWRDLAGFGLGASVAIGVGLLLGVSRFAEKLLGPTFHTFRQISLFAWLPLLSAMAGTGDVAKVIFIAFSAFYPVVLATLEGVKAVTPAHVEVARVLGFKRFQWLTRLILPAASPQILGGLRLGLIYAWLATIGAEYLLVNDGQGIGSTVFKGRMAFNVELIIFGLVTIGAVGYAFNRVAERAEQRLLRWRGSTH